MKHIPRSSRIFIGILIITLCLTYIAMYFSTYVADNELKNSPDVAADQKEREQAPQEPLLNTEGWAEYTNAEYKLSFAYPKGWKITGKKNSLGFFEITLNPGAKFNDMYIYASKDSYYGLDGLKQEPYHIGKAQGGFKVAENLFGIKTGEYFYTFDATTNSTQTSEFNTVLSTVKFE